MTERNDVAVKLVGGGRGPMFDGIIDRNAIVDCDGDEVELFGRTNTDTEPAGEDNDFVVVAVVLHDEEEGELIIGAIVETSCVGDAIVGVIVVEIADSVAIAGMIVGIDVRVVVCVDEAIGGGTPGMFVKQVLYICVEIPMMLFVLVAARSAIFPTPPKTLS